MDSATLLLVNLGATLLVAVLASLVFLKTRSREESGLAMSQLIISRFDEHDRSLAALGFSVKDQFATNRGETAEASRRLREELAQQFTLLSSFSDQQLERLRQALDQRLSQFKEELAGSRAEAASGLRGLREEIGKQSNSNDQRVELLRQGLDKRLNQFQEDTGTRMESVGSRTALASKELAGAVSNQSRDLRQIVTDLTLQTHRTQTEQTQSLTNSLSALANRLLQSHADFAAALQARFSSFQDLVNERLLQINSEFAANSQESRDENRGTLTSFGDSLRTYVLEMGQFQKHESEQLRAVVDQRLHALQIDNGHKLELMRQTVDEKLQGTLDARLGESFKQLSHHIEQVQQGLREMQTLAAGVGDLKKVLTNVKSRGIWGEIQLGSLLEQTLAPEQFEKNVATAGSGERVEYAIKLPGASANSHVWLPIDSKFPMEEFHRLIDASERADAANVELASQNLESVFKNCAKYIHENYIAPPATTDFGVLFLPTESLYAEAIRREGLVEYLQREYRIVVAGPTTLSALLSSLRMGFRTFAIQQRANEVWDLLGAVKNEFGKHADLLGKVKKKLEQASTSIEEAERKSRTIHRKLTTVEAPAIEGAAAMMSSVLALNEVVIAQDEAQEDEIEIGLAV